ncbi:M23 family metallopeptidase [Georgenia wangjunii]|uniref:M23 family metallopeptidase n=1 Tax=Georgenia wangjunii TaxID=3117730 RepID=UPI002F26A74B
MSASSSLSVAAAALAVSAVLVLQPAARDPTGSAPPAGSTISRDGTAPPQTAGGAPALAYAWPTLAEVPVLRAFDRPDAPWASGHRGVDLALAVGAPVHAAADGVVAFAGVVVDRPVVSVQHPDGVRTTYEPVLPAVTRGQAVAAGDVIGRLGTGGHCGACLHWGARRGSDDYLDPLSLLRGRVVIRLLPG